MSTASKTVATTAILFSLVVHPGGTALAAEPESAPATAPSAAVVPLMAGEVAAFDGLLVPEERFVEFLRQKIDLEVCSMRVAARDRALAAMPVAAPAAPAPVISGKFGTGVAVGVIGGIIVGVVAGVAMVAAATKVLTAAGN